jgi:hypothetical protein
MTGGLDRAGSDGRRGTRQGKPPAWRVVMISVLLGVMLSVSESSTADAQELNRVHLTNRSHNGVYVVVYDEVCGNVPFEGYIPDRATTTFSICGNRNRVGSIIVRDRRGRSVRFGNLGHPSRVVAQFR